MAYGLHHVARARLSLRANHARALRNAAQRLAQVAGPAHKRHGKLPLVYVERVVRGGEHLGLVDVVDVDGLQHLRLREVPYAALRHHGDGDGLLYAADHGGVAHAADAAGRADVRRDPLQRHHGARAGLLRYARLLGRRNVHDHAALQHLGQLAVELGALRSGRGDVLLACGHASSFCVCLRLHDR